VGEDGRIVCGEGWQKKYITEKNGRISWERQGIIAFCTCQWNEWMNWHAIGSRCRTLFWSHSQRSTGHPTHYLRKFLWNYQCITYILRLITTPYLPSVFSNILSSHVPFL
jgi:hypothetical protein